MIITLIILVTFILIFFHLFHLKVSINNLQNELTAKTIKLNSKRDELEEALFLIEVLESQRDLYKRMLDEKINKEN